MQNVTATLFKSNKPGNSIRLKTPLFYSLQHRDARDTMSLFNAREVVGSQRDGHLCRFLGRNRSVAVKMRDRFARRSDLRGLLDKSGLTPAVTVSAVQSAVVKPLIA